MLLVKDRKSCKQEFLSYCNHKSAQVWIEKQCELLAKAVPNLEADAHSNTQNLIQLLQISK